MKRFDVQVKINGEWKWPGVEPRGLSREEARRLCRRMKGPSGEAFWRVYVKATAFRVQEVKGA